MNETSENHRYEVVLPQQFLLGEGPLWDAKRNCICWIDILNGMIHEFEPSSGTHHEIELHDLIGTIALCTGGGYLAALKAGLAYVDGNTSEITLLFDPEPHMPENRFNDGKCDPSGRLWLGSMSLSEQEGAGSLYRIDQDRSCTLQLGGMTIPNGMAWSPDHKKFYHIDTPTRQIKAYDFDLASGEISNGRVVIEVPEPEGFPDGMTIDSEGMLWIAHFNGWQVARWDPQLGKKLFSFDLPVSQVTSCAFGGPTLTDLYITTASKELNAAQLDEQPLAGSLFVIKDCGFKGMESFRFNYNPALG